MKQILLIDKSFSYLIISDAQSREDLVSSVPTMDWFVGSAGSHATKSKPKHPTVTVNRLRTDKIKAPNISKSKTVKKVPKPGRAGAQYRKTETSLEKSPQKAEVVPDSGHFANQSDIILDEVLVAATETHRAMRRTVHIPRVLNENDHDEDEEEDESGWNCTVYTLHCVYSVLCIHCLVYRFGPLSYHVI